MIAKQPIHYFGLMVVAGIGFSQLIRARPELGHATVPPLMWMLGVALLYELLQKFVPALGLQCLTPMQRFGGFFAGALLLLLLQGAA